MSKRNTNHWRKVFLHTFLFLFISAVILLIFMIYLSKDLPSIEELKSFSPEQISKIISSDNQVIHKLQALKKREDAPKIPIWEAVGRGDILTVRQHLASGTVPR